MKSLLHPVFAALLLGTALLSPKAGHSMTVNTTADGIGINNGTMGTFTLGYPTLLDNANNPVHKIIEKTVTAQKAVVKYEGGAQATVEIEGAPGGSNAAITFANMPGDVKKFRMEMLVNFSFTDGGKWKMDNKESAFPREKQASPKLFQGAASTFQLTNQEGKTLRFSYESSYQELQDNREWNWKIFDWFFIAQYHSDWPRHIIKIDSGTGTAVGPVIIADQFGQDAKIDFPDKVKSEAELKADVQQDAQYYANLHPPATDQYGGLPGSREKFGLTKTGFFHVEKHPVTVEKTRIAALNGTGPAANRWLLVDPDGNAFFHLGICSFSPGDDYTYIKGREASYAWLPPYDGPFNTAFHPEPYWSHDAFSFYLANLIRKYGKPFGRDEWVSRMIPRVRALGFNSAGAFTGVSPLYKDQNFPYVLHLPGGPSELVPGLGGIFDPFAEGTPSQLDQAFAAEVASHAQDPLLIGYYLGNEQPFEDIPRVVPGLKAASASKRKLVAMLQQKYGTIAAFNTAWGMKAASFDELNDVGLPVTTKDAAADTAAFTEQFIDAYYSMIATTFHRYDKKHLLLGSRWQPGTANSEPLVRIAGKYMDIISVNYYTYGVDADFLKRLYHWSGDKPFFLSEWHYTSPSDSGLPGGKEVKTQEERGLAYRNYIEQSASFGFVVGTEWFTLIDQARTGRWFQRYDGENGNTGLFSVADRPWKQFLAQAVKTNDDIYKVELGERAPFAYADPRFTLSGTSTNVVKIPHAVGPIKIDGQRDGWPGNPPEQISNKRLVVGSDAGGLEASYRLCWDETNLYLLAHVTDATPMKNDQKGAAIWNGDGIELFIGHENLEQSGAMLFTDRQVLLSAGKPDGQYQFYYAHAPQQYPCEMFVAADVDGKGYTLEAAIPFAALGFKPQAGQEIRFDIGVDDASAGTGRTRQIMWNGIERNSSDRSAWGRGVLLK